MNKPEQVCFYGEIECHCQQCHGKAVTILVCQCQNPTITTCQICHEKTLSCVNHENRWIPFELESTLFSQVVGDKYKVINSGNHPDKVVLF